MSLTVINRPMYGEAYAARLLRISEGTLHYWLEGGRRASRTYEPVIRKTAHGSRAPVTWAEFVEAGLLRMYRRDHRMPMAELRAFIDKLRDEYQVPYPLADRRPFVFGRELVTAIQDEVGLDPEFCLVATVRGQYLLTPASQLFYDRVVWDGDVPGAWRPHSEPESPVEIRPDLRGGRPSVKGISTEAIWEHVDSGEDIDEIAEAFDLGPDDVRWANSYETAARAG